MPKVSLVKCESYDEEQVYHAIKKSIELIGGLNIKENSTVLLKPNILRPKDPKYAVTTHPSVIKALIRILKQKNCKIYVGDSPGFHNALTTAKSSGILAACEGAEFIDFENKKDYSYKDAILMKKLTLSSIIEKVDYIINLPKLKTHVMMGVTLAIKNTFGFMVGLDKSKMHMRLKEKEKFATMLVDLHNFIKPCINIMDGILGMEGNGPGNGDPIKTGVISASYDSLAMDIVLTKLIGLDPLSILTSKIALTKKEKNFIENISIVGEKLVDLKIKYKPSDEQPVTYIKSKRLTKIITNLITSRPKINTKKCVACQECIKICPAKTIHLKQYPDKKAAYINKKNCIRCFCCHEICHYDAIHIKKSFIGEIMEKFQNIVTKRQ